MRVVHVAPTPFGAGGLFGGGERYPLELARALAGSGGVECELLSFGGSPGVRRERSGLVVRVLRPLVRIHRHPAQPLVPGLAAEAWEPTSSIRTRCAAPPAGTRPGQWAGPAPS
jgi:alpha-maltose-1-phosphate synthase